MQLTAKECSLIKDLKGQEQLCVEKYTKYAAEASDAQLQTLFTDIANTEREHLSTLNSIENGSTPSVGSTSGNTSGGRSGNASTGSAGGSSNGSASGSSGGASGSAGRTFTKAPAGTDCKTDSYLCGDLLSTEKHASHLYDTCIFEFRDEAVRGTLAHIQQEEQNHGKMLYDYMKVNGMVSAQ
ncbi:MAG: spore coat protein [Clostridia bacterium]|nr:spore coat protein [Clostridia bacterium]